jgi:mannose-1-phosphate guanylyltransferase/mannose-6-phosphate isomerase
VDSGPRFQVKRIMVKPGGQLSLQKHFHRAEHWIVVRGTAEVTVNDRVSIVHENEAAYIPIGSIHRLANPGRIPLELIEVQVGSYTGEDDILRMDDADGSRGGAAPPRWAVNPGGARTGAAHQVAPTSAAFRLDTRLRSRYPRR